MDYSNINLEIIIRYLNGTCSKEEDLRLREWMQEDPVNEEFLLFVKKIWDTSSEKKKFKDVDSAWLRFNDQFDLDSASQSPGHSKITGYIRPKQKLSASGWLSWSAVAATIVLIVFVSLQITDFTPAVAETEVAEAIEYREVKTDKGQRTRLRLSDGSTVHLNAESRLLIPEKFNEKYKREVILEGEAFFEVTHDPDRQFVVTTDQAMTRVLGTKFNINSYGVENQIMVAVVEGAVSLENRSVDTVSVKTITKNQLGTFAEDGSTKVTDFTDMSEFLGWTNGNLVFRQDSLASVIKKLERWYGIDIHLNLDSGDRPDKKLTATFTDRQRLAEVLESISLVLDFEYKHHSYMANTFTFYNNQYER